MNICYGKNEPHLHRKKWLLIVTEISNNQVKTNEYYLLKEWMPSTKEMNLSFNKNKPYLFQKKNINYNKNEYYLN